MSIYFCNVNITKKIFILYNNHSTNCQKMDSDTKKFSFEFSIKYVICNVNLTTNFTPV